MSSAKALVSSRPVAMISALAFSVTAARQEVGLNGAIRIIVSAAEAENVKLFRQGGANSIVCLSRFGGHALVSAVDQAHMVQYTWRTC